MEVRKSANTTPQGLPLAPPAPRKGAIPLTGGGCWPMMVLPPPRGRSGNSTWTHLAAGPLTPRTCGLPAGAEKVGQLHRQHPGRDPEPPGLPGAPADHQLLRMQEASRSARPLDSDADSARTLPGGWLLTERGTMKPDPWLKLPRLPESPPCGCQAGRGHPATVSPQGKDPVRVASSSWPSGTSRSSPHLQASGSR